MVLSSDSYRAVLATVMHSLEIFEAHFEGALDLLGQNRRAGANNQSMHFVYVPSALDSEVRVQPRCGAVQFG